MLNEYSVVILAIVIFAVFIGLAICVFMRCLYFNCGLVIAFAIFFDFFSSFIGNMLPYVPPVLWFGVIFGISCYLSILNNPVHMLRFILRPIILIWLFILVYFLASVYSSCNPEYGMRKLSIFIFRGILPGLAVVFLGLSFKRLTWNPVLCVGIICALCLLLFGREVPEYPGRMVLGAANPIWLSRALLLSAAIALWYSGGQRWLRLLAIVLCMFGAIFTQSRGPLACFLFASALVFTLKIAFDRNIVLSRRILTGISSLIIVSVSTIFIFSGLIEIPLHLISKSFSRFEVLINPDLLVTDMNFIGRMQAQEHALNLFASHPFAGIGLGGFAPKDARLYPHNLPLEIASETGMLGVLLWCSGVGGLLYAARGQRLLQVLLLQTILYTFVSGDLGSNFEYVLIGIVAVGFRNGVFSNRNEIAEDAIINA